MAESRKKAENDKRRDKLNKLLVAKYQRKYGKSIPLNIIVREVNTFLDTMKPTAQNMKVLEDRLLSSTGKAPKMDKRKASMPAAVRKRPEPAELSHLSEFHEKPVASPVKQDLYSTGDSSMPMTEDDEWGSIIKFNHSLYQEEVRQEMLRKERQKKYMKSELDKQIKEKHDIKDAINKQENDYLEYQSWYLKHQNELEKQKEKERRDQMLNEKHLREKQRKDNAMRREMEDNENKDQDRKLVQRMRQEIAIEHNAELARRKMERETLTKMMEESLKSKEEQKLFEKREKEDDIKRQERQKQLDEIKEKEWRDNMRRKDEHNKLLVENSLKASGSKIIKNDIEVEDKRRLDQMRILEQRADEEEEIKLLTAIEAKRNMKEVLNKQVEEKHKRKQFEKNEDKEQAQMWKEKTRLMDEQEKKNERVFKEASMKNQDYIMRQMIATRQERGKRDMSRKEYLMNKRLVDDMKTKYSKLRATTSGFH